MNMTLIAGADIYSPAHLGHTDLLFVHEHIFKIGKIDRQLLLKSKLQFDVLDATKKILIPGIIDPHSHILGGSGEEGGFSSQTPEFSASEYILGGTTTVVGTLGLDTTMKTMAGLLAKVKGFNDEGLSASLYTGGYSCPPATIMKTVKEDIMFIHEVIGVGELAISDERSEEPTRNELARIVVDSYVSGTLADKAGVTHFHVGSGKKRLQPLRDLLDSEKDIKAEWLYPTHIQDNPKLIAEGVALAKRGSFIDFDVVEKNLHKSLKTFREAGGNISKLTVSSDSSDQSPQNVWRQVRNCVLHHRFLLENILPLVTSNPAKILKFHKKGEIKTGNEASFILLDSKSLEITDVFSKGQPLLRDRQLVFKEKFLKDSDRNIHLVGAKFNRS